MSMLEANDNISDDMKLPFIVLQTVTFQMHTAMTIDHVYLQKECNMMFVIRLDYLA